MSILSDNFNAFYTAESRLTTAAPTQISGRGVYSFNGSTNSRIPMHVRTGQQSFGSPTERKKFTQIEFHGKGTVWCRVYVDGVYTYEAGATLTETPAKDRRIGLPVGIRGYTIDVEFCGDADIRAVEFETKPMSGIS